jgi:sirohydrochlorin ferrochelatase
MSLLLIAHGSPDPRHRAAIAALAARVAAESGTSTQVGYLEHDAPLATDVLATERSAHCGDEPLRVLGLFLSDGHHALVDVPAVLADAVMPVVDCGSLGLGSWLIDALEVALSGLDTGQGTHLGIALVAAGSAKPQARDDVLALAASWQRARGTPVRAAFASGPGPTITEALGMLADAGCQTPVLALLMLAPGVLADRVRAVGTEHGVAVTDPLLTAVAGEPAAPLVTRILELTTPPVLESPRR